MKDGKAVEAFREAMYVAQDMADDANYSRYIAGVIDAINYILEV